MHQVINCFVHSRSAFWVNKPFIYFVKPYLAMYFKYQSICFHTPTLFSPPPTRAVGTQTAHCWILLTDILIPPNSSAPLLLRSCGNTSWAFRGPELRLPPCRPWAFPGADNLSCALLLLLLLISADATALQVARILPLRPSLLLCDHVGSGEWWMLGKHEPPVAV